MLVFNDNKYTINAKGVLNDTITSKDVLNDISVGYTYTYMGDSCGISVDPPYTFNNGPSYCCAVSSDYKKSSEKEEKKDMKSVSKEKEIKIKIPDKDGNITIKTIVVPVPYQPRRIFFDPPATVVFWEDDTKTVVRCMEDDEFNPYYGFVCALGKKMFGTNNEIARMIKNAEWKYDKNSKNKEKKVETKPASKPKKTQSNKNSKKEKPKK